MIFEEQEHNVLHTHPRGTHPSLEESKKSIQNANASWMRRRNLHVQEKTDDDEDFSSMSFRQKSLWGAYTNGGQNMRKFEGDFGPSIGRMNMTLAPSKLRERCD
jgi:hypothetical protein